MLSNYTNHYFITYEDTSDKSTWPISLRSISFKSIIYHDIMFVPCARIKWTKATMAVRRDSMLAVVCQRCSGEGKDGTVFSKQLLYEVVLHFLVILENNNSLPANKTNNILCRSRFYFEEIHIPVIGQCILYFISKSL